MKIPERVRCFHCGNILEIKEAFTGRAEKGDNLIFCKECAEIEQEVYSKFLCFPYISVNAIGKRRRKKTVFRPQY